VAGTCVAEGDSCGDTAGTCTGGGCEAGACGTIGGACCMDGLGCTESYAFCNGGVCDGCGGLDQPCCDGCAPPYVCAGFGGGATCQMPMP
jgi:hypothetical protein